MASKGSIEPHSNCEISYKMESWFDYVLPEITVTMKSTKTTYRFTGSYDGCHALTAKLFTHMVNDDLESESENCSDKAPNGGEIHGESCYNGTEQS